MKVATFGAMESVTPQVFQTGDRCESLLKGRERNREMPNVVAKVMVPTIENGNSVENGRIRSEFVPDEHAVLI